MNVLTRVLFCALVVYLIAPSAARAADKADEVDDKAACLAREAAKGHDAAASALICHLRSVFQSRIRYKPDAEPVEMTVGSPPMISDDTDTPGPGNVELNLVFNGAWSPDARALAAPLFDVNFGIGERLQLKYEVPYAIERHSERDASGAQTVTSERGIGDSNLGLKYRFYDDSDSGLSLGVYPQTRFRTPGARRALSAGNTSFALPLLLTKEFSNASVTANLGIEYADAHSDYYASVGIGTRINDHLAAMLELAGDGLREADSRRGIANVGVRYKLSDKQALLTSVGRDFHAPDGSTRASYVSIAYQRVFGK
ncbi:MAG: transporter family protein [Gammaproteobacteria bacterium]